MKNKILKYLLAFSFALMLVIGARSPLVYAQEATQSSKTTLKLKERIERIVEEKKEQVKGIISNLTSNKQGFIGEVLRVTEESVTIKTNKATKIIPLDETVTILKKNKEVAVADIAIENWVVVMGIIEDDAFKPVRILVSDDSLRPKPHTIILGSINSIERSLITITPRSEETPLNATLNSKTIYEDINGEEIVRDDIEEETQALIIAYDDKNSKIAKRIRILTVIEEK